MIKSTSILDTANPTSSMTPDFLAIALDGLSKRAPIKQSGAQAMMVAGFASDGVATRAWTFVITDKDGEVDTFVECTGIDEFGNDDLAWKRNRDGAISKVAQSAYKKALQKTFFNMPDSDPALWTSVSKAILIARAIREEGMTATVVNGTLRLEGGHSHRAAAMRNAESLSALAKIAKSQGEALHRGKVREQEISEQAMPQKPTVERAAIADTIRSANSFRPLSNMVSFLARASRASANDGESHNPAFVSSSNQLPSVHDPVQGTKKLNEEIVSPPCGAEFETVDESRDLAYLETTEAPYGPKAKKKTAMLNVTVQLPRHVVERYPDLKAMRDDWVRHVENLPYLHREAEISSSDVSFARGGSLGNGYSIRIIEKIKSANDRLLGVQFGLACIADDISVSEASRKLGVTRPTIYSWFLGTSLPRDTKATIIRAFLASRRADPNM